MKWILVYLSAIVALSFLMPVERATVSANAVVTDRALGSVWQ